MPSLLDENHDRDRPRVPTAPPQTFPAFVSIAPPQAPERSAVVPAIDGSGGAARNSHDFLRDLLGREHKVDTPGGYGALGHIRLHGGIEPLRDGRAPHVPD